MLTSTHKYVVLGAGNSAGYVAREFAERGVAHGDLCLVGEESVLPYERPALSKAVLMKENVRLPGFHTSVGGGGVRQDIAWYESYGIGTRIGEHVESVDIAKRALYTSCGDCIIATDALVLATGASPIVLSRLDGADLPGIHYLRNNDQAEALYEALQAARGKTVLVVGGGYIGLEVAAAAATVGCKVKMIFPETHVMPRLFTPEIALHYEQVYRDHGVEFLNNGRLCKAFVPGDDGRVRAVRFCKNGDDEEVACDLVVVGVGARANTSMFKDQVEMDDRGGVVVDASLRTSVAGAYAIGDIASFPLKMYDGRMVRMEHVVNARQSAKHVVGAILGDKEAYDYLPYFYSRVFNLSWKFYGDNDGDCIVVGDFKPKLLAAWVKDGVVNGIFMESASDEDTASMQKIARARPTVDVVALAKAESADAALALLV